MSVYNAYTQRLISLISVQENQHKQKSINSRMSVYYKCTVFSLLYLVPRPQSTLSSCPQFPVSRLHQSPVPVPAPVPVSSLWSQSSVSSLPSPVPVPVPSLQSPVPVLSVSLSPVQDGVASPPVDTDARAEHTLPSGCGQLKD